jgi:hypothetical protein
MLLRKAKDLVGATVVEAGLVDLDTGRQVAEGKAVRMAAPFLVLRNGSREFVVAVLSDDEGNGPGTLDIVEREAGA